MRARIIALTAVALMIVRVSAAASPHITAEQARQWLISAPQPAYPESARVSRIQGSGYFKLIVRVKTGRIQRIVVFRSTGSSTLDTAAVQALRQWRFKPGVLPSMRQLHPPSKEPDADKNACILVPISFVR
jgi:TonB family protein